jgi:asparagine synthase (glutamine-hydrolysing)
LNGVGKFLLSAFVRDQGYKVVLTGEGSDEHFGGYPFFHADYLREADLATPNGFGTIPDDQHEARLKLFGMKGEFSNYLDNIINEKNVNEDTDHVRRMVNNINFHTLVSKSFCLSNPSYYSDASLAQCGNPNPALAMAEAINGIARFKANTKWHPLHSALYVENHTILPNYLCNVLGDRSEMAHSIEARTPFLDHHLCEYVNHLPPSLKIKTEADGTLNEKWVLKEAVKPFITEEIYNRTKQPFVAPASKGRNPMVINLISKLLTKENIDKLGWINFGKFNEAKKAYLQTGSEVLFKDMLIMMSYVVLSQRFNVAAYGISETADR